MEELEKKLNYTFRDRGLLSEALSHSSYANEHRSAHLRSNERLEFLGDSVLGFVTAEFLFAQHPDLPEGDLTRIRRRWCASRASMRWPASWTWAGI